MIKFLSVFDAHSAQVTGQVAQSEAMIREPILLTARIIADLRFGEERAEANSPELRVHCRRQRASSPHGALRQIKLGQFGPVTRGAATSSGREAAAAGRILQDFEDSPAKCFGSLAIRIRWSARRGALQQRRTALTAIARFR